MPLAKVAGVLALTALLGCSSSEAAAPDPADSRVLADDNAAQEATMDAPQLAGQSAPTLSVAGEFTQGGYIRGQLPAGTQWDAKLGDEPLTISPDGRFFAAFDRDAPRELTLEAVSAAGKSLSQTLKVSPRDWQISRVNVAKRGGGSSEAWWKKREPEWNAIVAARAKMTNAQGWRQDFIWPVKGRISGLFGRQRIYRGEPGSYHSGIDIAPGNGVPFVAPADGVVVLARTGFSMEGGLIIIDHGAGLNSAFLHASKIMVQEGQSVVQGDHIGNVGATGRATGPHLHWSLKWRGARLDPLLFTGPMN